jgi:hypothetical protein
MQKLPDKTHHLELDRNLAMAMLVRAGTLPLAPKPTIALVICPSWAWFEQAAQPALDLN